jgi:two-component system phosphate regulon sensor histidine kinase PhoR
VERLINIVTDLDMINKYEAGEINLKLENFDINSLIKEIFELLDLEAQKMDAKLILQTSSSLLLVNADKQRISQVLINLVSNAIHYSNREKAQVVVSTKPIGDKILIEVHDNGMGSSRNRKDGGSGLGLAIVKHILHAHGENIEAQSTYLEGTTFRFLLKKEKK